MKKTAILIAFIYCICSYGQKIENTKKMDTIYVKFKKSKNQTKIVAENYRFYTFSLGKITDGISLYFTKPNFIDYLEQNDTNQATRLITKSNLRKHRKNIVGIKFFNKYGIEKCTYDAFSPNCIFYIFECDEQKNGKFKLYRVQKGSSYQMGE